MMRFRLCQDDHEAGKILDVMIIEHDWIYTDPLMQHDLELVCRSGKKKKSLRFIQLLTASHPLLCVICKLRKGPA